MRVLLSSHRFYPDVGGIETVSMLLARAFVESGHEVVIVTQTAGEDVPGWSFQVVRRPRVLQLMRLVRDCDVLVQNHLSLQTAWPLLLVRRNWVLVLQTWLPRSGWSAGLKRWSLRFARRLYISQAIARDAGLPGEVIGNPYDDSVFRFPDEEDRQFELIFVGRLVSDKGMDLLLDAMARLRERGLTPGLTVIGSGPEEGSLREQAVKLGIEAQVRFAGSRSGHDLAQLLQRHRVLVVPSRWAEPFGIVALEGIACGCRVVASDQGGLPEAVGRCGGTFPNGDLAALVDRLEEELSNGSDLESLRSSAAAHLAPYRQMKVASACLQTADELVAPGAGE
jgi:glycogen synthase